MQRPQGKIILSVFLEPRGVQGAEWVRGRQDKTSSTKEPDDGAPSRPGLEAGKACGPCFWRALHM